MGKQRNMDAWQEFEKQVLNCVEGPLEKPKMEHGDLAYPCFAMAKKRKLSPVAIAQEIAGSIETGDFTLIEKVEASGPYVNFFLDYDSFAALLVKDILESGGEFGKAKLRSGKSLVEFPSVNPNKPWHIGHARNAVLGDTMARLLEAVGYDVIRTDYIDNLGLQVAKTLWGVQRFGVGDGKYDLELGKVYAKAESEMDKKQAEEEVRSILKRIEEGEDEIAQKAREMCERCVKAQHQTGQKLGVFHDLMVWEGDIVRSGLFEEALTQMKDSPLVFMAEEGKKKGCLVADFSGIEEFSKLEDPLKVLLRSDGTATYVAKDIAFQMWKCGLIEDPFVYTAFEKQSNSRTVYTTSQKGERKKWGEPKIVVNVIGMPQAHPQRMVYTTLKVMGYDFAFEKSFHLSYANVAFEEDGEVVQFSGRKGNWLDYTVDTLLQRAEEKAYLEVDKRNAALGEEEKKNIAKAVGSGAVRYALLKTAPEKEIVFRWEDALSFEGDSAPYLQYAHARACRILEKAKPKACDFRLEEAEKVLVRKLAQFPSIVRDIPLGMKHEVWGTSVAINTLCEYCCTLAADFNTFYNCCRVLGSEKETQRLNLVRCFQQVMHNGLTLLGVEPVRKM